VVLHLHFQIRKINRRMFSSRKNQQKDVLPTIYPLSIREKTPRKARFLVLPHHVPGQSGMLTNNRKLGDVRHLKAKVPSKSRMNRILKNAGHTILDVGCGNGSYVWHLSKRAYKIYGIDLSPRPCRAEVSHCLIKGDACHLPFKDESFDTVLMINTLEHMDDRAALKEAYRICKKNIIFSVPHEEEGGLGLYGTTSYPYVDQSHLRYYTLKTVKSTFANAGFRTDEINYHGPINPAGLFLSTLHLPHSFSALVGNMVNSFPIIKKHYINIEGIATKVE
jgi:SAM-dependent methyltransferase